MKLILEEMRDIARTLPIGYYLGRKVPVLVEEHNNAYCDIVKGDVHIGIGLLQQAADRIDASDAAAWDREKLLRCLLYHEIGHLLLTPKFAKALVVRRPSGKSFSLKESAEITNIFEDERLERILSRFFIGVDFKAFVNLIHKGVKFGRSEKDRFFAGIRLGKCSKAALAAIDEAIKMTLVPKAITASPPDACFLPNGDYWHPVSQYREAVEAAVKAVLEDKPEEDKPDKSKSDDGKSGKSKPDKSKSDEDEGDSGDDQKDDGKSDDDKSDDSNDGDGEDDGKSDDDKPADDGKSDGGKPDDGEQNEGQPDEECSPDEDDEHEAGHLPLAGLGPDFLKEIASQVFATPTQEVANALNRFALRLSKKQGRQSAGRWSALHGKLSTRRAAMGKERMFRRSSDVGEAIMSRVHLTLWVDVSGSFCESEPVLNGILAAVASAVKLTDKLTVDVVKMNNNAIVAKPEEWQIKCNGGNDINPTYYDAWKATRRKGCRNIDIVVFDGIAKYSDSTPEDGYNAVNGVLVEKVIWNHPDCHILADTSNEFWTEDLTRAHVQLMPSEYAEALEAEVLKILDRIL